MHTTHAPARVLKHGFARVLKHGFAATGAAATALDAVPPSRCAESMF